MKYWAYMKGTVPGSYEPEALAALPDFAMTTLVCPTQGEIAEKNWRRAGEFDDIVRAVEAHSAQMPPLAPLGAPPTAQASEVNALLDAVSVRLFSHVADLMKELETRRDETALSLTLQREIAALKQELELATQRLQETSNDLTMRNRLVDKLSRDLSEKELSLAKSLGVIQRLEEDLNRLCPTAEPKGWAAEPKGWAAEPKGWAAEPKIVPLLPEPTESPQAHQALLNFLRKIFPGQTH